MRALGVVITLAMAVCHPAPSHAYSEIVIQALGSGFVDHTPVKPVGGNPGRTLGEQRLLALQRAASIWEEALDSKVPIIVQITFKEFPCEEGNTVLADARPSGFVSGLDAQATVKRWYPIALADRLSGRDLAPDEPDILVRINSSLDDECRRKVGGWYYGFDHTSSEHDLIATVLHELAHGLGFVTMVDKQTGEFAMGSGIDAFGAQIIDLTLNKRWDVLSAAERARSSVNYRQVAFDGEETKRASAGELRLDSASDSAKKRLGTDASGRPLLYTPSRLTAGSSVSHFDDGASPDLLMEWAMSPAPDHELDLTLAVLHDIGWTPFCGNGALDQEEECDDGPSNTDSLADGCRTTCLRAACGDGVLDSGEACDDGLANSDQRSDACRTDCRKARCGDGVVDASETCDEGAANSDLKPGACREDCSRPRCGDGIVDPGEACDGTPFCSSCAAAPTVNTGSATEAPMMPLADSAARSGAMIPWHRGDEQPTNAKARAAASHATRVGTRDYSDAAGSSLRWLRTDGPDADEEILRQARSLEAAAILPPPKEQKRTGVQTSSVNGFHRYYVFDDGRTQILEALAIRYVPSTSPAETP